MRRCVVINVVGLTPGQLGPDMPNMTAWAGRGRQATIGSVMPAVTCSVQATYLTGAYPERHGVVGNGWYFKDECEIRFWRQSNKLVHAPKVWEVARALDPSFTCANMFWWFNMYSAVDFAATPRPMYPADGRKLPDIHTQPPELRSTLQRELGQFPLFEFWGPRTTIRSSQWIADAARQVEHQHRPTLTLVYLPHLDYNLQRLGPHDPAIRDDLRALDRVAGELIAFYEERDVEVIVLSEYGISEVSRHVAINQEFRRRGWLQVREELGLELLDAGASRAFAVCDHQLAHVYVQDPDLRRPVREALQAMPGVAEVWDEAAQRRHRLWHARSGDLVAVADPDAWFSYYYWLNDAKAPDFARTVDIHRKPGYDPAELFFDPAINVPALKVGWTLLKRRLGFRALLEVVPLDPSLVRGSHGRAARSAAEAPVFLTRRTDLLERPEIGPDEVFTQILKHLGLETSPATLRTG